MNLDILQHAKTLKHPQLLEYFTASMSDSKDELLDVYHKYDIFKNDPKIRNRIKRHFMTDTFAFLTGLDSQKTTGQLKSNVAKLQYAMKSFKSINKAMFENQQLLDTKMNSSLSRLNQLEEEIASGNAFNKQVSLLLTSCQHFNDISRLISSNFQQLSNLYGGNGNLFNLITHKTMKQIISDVNEPIVQILSKVRTSDG